MFFIGVNVGMVPTAMGAGSSRDPQIAILKLTVRNLKAKQDDDELTTSGKAYARLSKMKRRIY